METLLKVDNLTKKFTRKNYLVNALDHVSFTISNGECMGLIGESGSGKSTIARILAGFEKPDGGQVYFQGIELTGKSVVKNARKEMQMIFQNPVSSLNPQMSIGQNMDEALRYYVRMPKANRSENCKKMLEKVQLPAGYYYRYPKEISGGECQRVCIARALLRKPSFLICDEVTSALDVSVQKEIMDLLKELQKELKMGILFISHDLALVADFCSQIVVLEKGKIVESGSADQVVNMPQNEYTRNLLDSVIRLDLKK